MLGFGAFFRKPRKFGYKPVFYDPDKPSERRVDFDLRTRVDTKRRKVADTRRSRAAKTRLLVAFLLLLLLLGFLLFN